jgi:hypothetical protein
LVDQFSIIKNSFPIDIADMEAECSEDVMKLRVKFNDTFDGLVYSAGMGLHFFSSLAKFNIKWVDIIIAIRLR